MTREEALKELEYMGKLYNEEYKQGRAIKYAVEKLQEPKNIWQHIDTHNPKTHHKILLWHKGVYKVPHIGWYNYADRQYELVEAFKDSKDLYVKPTHWMPIPEFKGE